MRHLRVRTTALLPAVALITVVTIAPIASPAVASGLDDTAFTALKRHGLLASPEDMSEAALNRDSRAGLPSAAVDSAAGLTIPTSEGTMSLVPVGAAEPREVDGKLLYTEKTHSIAATTTASGVANAMYAVLTGPESPSSYRYEVSVDDAPALLTQVDGAVLVRNPAGEIVNVLNPAWAVDAGGISLPTHYEIEGNEIIQVVDHRTATYPVVADPAGACDALSCTIFFNKPETRTASEGAAAAAGLLCGAMAFLNGIAGVVCGAYGAALTIVAIQARNQGDCLAFRASRYGLYTPYPFIYDDARCR